MKVLVMGAGAVGAYYGARLQQAGEEVVLCARGANLEAMRRDGLRVRSHMGDFALPVTATADRRDFAPYDLILFCVKSYDTDKASRLLAGSLVGDGVILTVQNGIENEARLREAFGAEGVMTGNADRRRNGRTGCHRPSYRRRDRVRRVRWWCERTCGGVGGGFQARRDSWRANPRHLARAMAKAAMERGLQPGHGAGPQHGR